MRGVTLLRTTDRTLFRLLLELVPHVLLMILLDARTCATTAYWPCTPQQSFPHRRPRGICNGTALTCLTVVTLSSMQNDFGTALILRFIV